MQQEFVYQRKGQHSAKPSYKEDVLKKIKEKSRTVSERKLFFSILFIRLSSIILVQSYFAPDEYWQSLEVAHNIAFGYGYLSWEWKVGVRPYLYPLAISAIYKTLQLVGLDTPVLLVIMPRVCQAFFSAVSEVLFYRFTKEHFGSNVAFYTTFSLCTSWFWFYCGTRTLMNTIETCFVCIGFYFFCWNLDKPKKQISRALIAFTIIASLSVVLRPTSLSMWVPLYIWFFSNYFDKIMAGLIKLIQTAVISVFILIFSTLVDRLFYGSWVSVHYNFLHFNFISGQASIYGTQPWHWYLSEGLPVAAATHLPLVLAAGYVLTKNKLEGCLSLDLGHRVLKLLLISMISTVIMYSLIEHKEHRFILNIVPILCLFSGITLASLKGKWKKLFIIWLLVTNIPMSLYFGLIHQSGPLPVVRFLSNKILPSDIFPSDQLHSEYVFFLMPCHATPYYSHIHHNVSMQALTCHPKLDVYDQADYFNEESVFFQDPRSWIHENMWQFSKSKKSCPYTLPKHLVMYDLLYYELKNIFLKCYKKCFETFHTHFPEGNMGRSMVVLCR